MLEEWVGDATFYKWRSDCGGVQVSLARQFNALEEEESAKRMWLLTESIPEMTSDAPLVEECVWAAPCQ